MHLIHLIKFWVLTIVYKARRAVPLYMNDHARIASLYAWSLLALLQSASLSNTKRFQYLQLFAKNFSLPISIGRLAETLYADPNREAFEDYCNRRLSTGNLTPHTRRVLARLPLALSRIPKDSNIKENSFRERFFYPKRPVLDAVFAKLTFNSTATSLVDKFILTSHYKPNAQNEAILILPLGKLGRADIEALKGYQHITVMPQKACDFKQVKTQLQNILGRNVEILFYEPKARHAAPYSAGNVYISGFCDDLAAQTLDFALKNRAVRNFIPKALHNDVSLMISDVIYEPVQTFYATLRAIETQGHNIPIFYVGPAKALPRTLARSRKNPIFVMTHGTSVETDRDIINHSQDRKSNKHIIKDIRRTFKYLSARSLAAAPTIDMSASPHIYLATNTWSPTYAKAAELITEKLSEIAPVSIFDYAAPAGLHKNIQASLTPCLHNALLSSRSSDISLISQYINLAGMISPETLALGEFPAFEMKELLIKALEKELGAILGNILLYKELTAQLQKASNAVLIQCPGRFGSIRCLGHAFQAAELMTIDVQALFVGEMARYRPPMTEHMTVIDSYAKDFYTQQWNISSDNITTIGSILLDEDIKAALKGDRIALKQSHLSAVKETVITYASQTLPDREVIKTIKYLAQYMKQHGHGKHLCVKLHPAQDHVTQAMIENFLKDTFADNTCYTVIKNAPFSDIMPFTDILISYFSNVCLLAPAFKKPVITLSTSIPAPAMTLEQMGLATHVKDYDTLSQTIEKLLKNSEDDFYKGYLTKNPHMTDVSALDRLSSIVKNSIGVPSNS